MKYANRAAKLKRYPAPPALPRHPCRHAKQMQIMKIILHHHRTHAFNPHRAIRPRVSHAQVIARRLTADMPNQELEEHVLLHEAPNDGDSAVLADTQDDSNASLPDITHPARPLYISHFLSTWNSRAFEFGAFLFLASIFPGTLLPASIYALSRAGAAALLSPWLGKYVDSGERLKVVRLSIGKQTRKISG